MIRIDGRKPFVVLLALAAVILLAACGDGDGEPTPPEATADNSPAAPGATVSAVTIESLSLAVGTEGSTELRVLEFPAPGLGAWTIDVTHDSSVVSIISCESPQGSSVCNPEFGDDTARIAGAVGVGLEGDTVVATIVYRCEAAGSSPLKVTVDVLADATIGDPQPVQPSIDDGEISCAG